MGKGSLALLVALVLAHAVVVAQPADAACGATGTPTTTVYLPNITKTLGGPTGWVTPFIVQNVGAGAATLEVSFYRFSDGSLVTCQTVPGVLPQRSFAHVPNNDPVLPGDSQFSVVVRSFGSPVEAVVNQHQGAGSRAEALSYVGLTSGATRVGLPWIAKAFGGWVTTFVVQNLGTATANVTIALANEDGTRSATLARSVVPGRSTAIDPSVEASLVAGTVYAALLTSDQPIGVIANAHNDAPTVPRPMAFSYNGIAGTTGDAYLPWAGRNVDGNLYSSVVVQNIGTFDATPTLTFRRIGGTEQVVRGLGVSLRPGRATVYSFPAADPNCPVTGGASCPREGEHSVQVTGGQFAVLGYAVGPSSAMALTGGTTSPARVYLPNVTRTLGGASGWTTPIVLQSAGATSAILRWYRFTDGSLVATQYVGALIGGSSVRIDPRTVTGLAEGTQYAVVVDATTGPFRSIVLELSSAGGDGAMAYEGFSAAGALTPAPIVAALNLSPVVASVALGEVHQFTISGRDQAANAISGVPISWELSSAALGTIDPTGRFTAGNEASSGTITARFGGLTASATVTTFAKTTTQGGVTFSVRAAGGADVFIESTITSADAQTIFSVVDGDVTHIQTIYGRTFAARPKVYVYASTATYGTGLERIVGMPRDRALNTAANAAGVFSQYSRDKVSMNWSELSDVRPVSIVRHELTHMMVEQIAKPTIERDVPAWVNEGSAELEEHAIAGNGWYVNLGRFTAVSMVVNGTAYPLAQITDQGVWNARTGLAATVQYYQAGELVRLLRQDIGTAGVTRLLELMGQGQHFDAAFASVAGKSVAAFETTTAARIRAMAPSLPGVATSPDQLTGSRGLSYVMYGFAPSSAITIDILGQELQYRNSLRTFTTNAFGVFSSYLGASWPSDTYSITVTQGATVVRVSAVKASSFGMAEVRLVA